MTDNNTPAIQRNYNLIKFNTMGVKAQADYFISVKDITELKNALEFAKINKLPFLVLGGGSNMLFIDNFKGIVIYNQLKGVNKLDENDQKVILEVMGGENWHDFVINCVNKNYGGIENLSLIPGTVGAAPIQNIGAYGVEIKDVLQSVEYLDANTLEIKTITPDKCKFGYRNSIFKNELKGQIIITSIQLKLTKKPKINVEYRALRDYLAHNEIINPGIKEISDAVIAIRQSKLPDPKQIGNSGSFFKNPVVTANKFEELKDSYNDLPGYILNNKEVKIPAAWLIDKAGWKGKRKGDAGVHKQQALVLVNYGEATGNDIYMLSKEIQEDINAKFGIKLEREVNIIE